ncbi:organic cation transporter protein-like isoform X2 [Ctenocephalides felis]|nr:organic cation transporter protein-like isoform X2 [Ctenocephalides felis]
MFFLISSIGIFNGIHAISTIFIAIVPDTYNCKVPELTALGWSDDQIRSISVPGNVEQSCKMYNRDYAALANMTDEDLNDYLKTHSNDSVISCKYGMEYVQEPLTSFVTEWDLVCERLYLRSTITTALGIGKFAGAFIFGVIADKYGRKLSIIIGSIIFIITAPLQAVVNDFLLYFFLRFLVGVSGIGAYNTAYTLLSEISGPKHRGWMSIVINLSYAIGMIIISCAYYFFKPWRQLQLATSIPTVLLLIHCWLLPESPRWLINKGRSKKAAKIVFGRKYEYNVASATPATSTQADGGKKPSCWQKVKNSFVEITDILKHTEMRHRLLICLVTWFSSALGYYAMAINDINLPVEKMIYGIMSGSLECISYFIPLPLLKFCGRRTINFLLFMSATACFIPILSFSLDYAYTLMVISLIGRLFMSAVFAVVILHTLELFPTSNRSTAQGLSSTMANVGSISAPYIVDLLGDVSWQFPIGFCGVFAFISAVLVLLLPETKGRPMCDTPDDIDGPEQGKVSIKNISCRRRS